MTDAPRFIDIHCHLLPGLDDGAHSWEDAIEMARIARADGIRTIIATPHQLGSYGHIRAELIRSRTAELQDLLQRRGIYITVLPGANVHVQEDLVRNLVRGDVLTLADQRRHVLVELPRHRYVPLEELIAQLQRGGIATVLAHPERNQFLSKQPKTISSLVNRGCLMQITASSLLGTFGPLAQHTSEWMLQQRLVHFVATDAHAVQSRRPLLRRSYERVCELVGHTVAQRLCYGNAERVVQGEPIDVAIPMARSRSRMTWLPWKRAA